MGAWDVRQRAQLRPAAWTAREEAGGIRAGAPLPGTRARSWLLRWFGGLASDAVGDFRHGAEAEADRYHRACLLALRDDVVALARP